MQLDEECAKVFVMETDSMGFDYNQPPFSGQSARFGEKDYMRKFFCVSIHLHVNYHSLKYFLLPKVAYPYALFGENMRS